MNLEVVQTYIECVSCSARERFRILLISKNAFIDSGSFLIGKLFYQIILKNVKAILQTQRVRMIAQFVIERRTITANNINSVHSKI